MRLQIYRASGGYVVETKAYDHHKDRNFHTMHVITEDQDLGDALGKIVMMEALKR
jgi:3-methyladenine DNA glycosylase Mpg